jgi:hypothetical protein
MLEVEIQPIGFGCPARGEGVVPGNTGPWAQGYFNGEDPRVQILGLSLKDGYRYRTDPVILPAEAPGIAIWLIDDGVSIHQLVFYRINDEWRWHFRESDEDKQKYIQLKELPDDEGRCRQPTDSTDRYILLSNGELKIYAGSGKLLDHVSQQAPPPPVRRTAQPSAKIR